mmetsp:Transcript_113795/g.197753  ORF Transcript_113795/g.197753 Transcript_113795/m.197753 type:complete len:280 (+) Transcript_113795:221-1060(+)
MKLSGDASEPPWPNGATQAPAFLVRRKWFGTVRTILDRNTCLGRALALGPVPQRLSGIAGGSTGFGPRQRPVEPSSSEWAKSNTSISIWWGCCAGRDVSASDVPGWSGGGVAESGAASCSLISCCRRHHSTAAWLSRKILWCPISSSSWESIRSRVWMRKWARQKVMDRAPSRCATSVSARSAAASIVTMALMSRTKNLGAWRSMRSCTASLNTCTLANSRGLSKRHTMVSGNVSLSGNITRARNSVEFGHLPRTTCLGVARNRTAMIQDTMMAMPMPS